jgi:hypothetical protein
MHNTKVANKHGQIGKETLCLKLHLIIHLNVWSTTTFTIILLQIYMAVRIL